MGYGRPRESTEVIHRASPSGPPHAVRASAALWMSEVVCRCVTTPRRDPTRSILHRRSNSQRRAYGNLRFEVAAGRPPSRLRQPLGVPVSPRARPRAPCASGRSARGRRARSVRVHSVALGLSASTACVCFVRAAPMGAFGLALCTASWWPFCCTTSPWASPCVSRRGGSVGGSQRAHWFVRVQRVAKVFPCGLALWFVRAQRVAKICPCGLARGSVRVHCVAVGVSVCAVRVGSVRARQLRIGSVRVEGVGFAVSGRHGVVWVRPCGAGVRWVCSCAPRPLGGAFLAGCFGRSPVLPCVGRSASSCLRAPSRPGPPRSDRAGTNSPRYRTTTSVASTAHGEEAWSVDARRVRSCVGTALPIAYRAAAGEPGLRRLHHVAPDRARARQSTRCRYARHRAPRHLRLTSPNRRPHATGATSAT